MKETTRQIVLLFGVLTLLTSSYIVVNVAGNTNTGDTEPQVNDSVNDQNTSLQNDTDPSESSTGDSSEEESEGLIGNSIRGFQILIEDMGRAVQFLSSTEG